MLYLGAILFSIALFTAFLWLTASEAKRGVRVMAVERGEFDAFTRRLTFIFEHVDFASFLRHLLVTAAETVAHEFVRIVLLAVRALERALTRLVRYLHLRRVVPLESVSAPVSPFVATITTFKHRLRKEHAENKAVAELGEALESENGEDTVALPE